MGCWRVALLFGNVVLTHAVLHSLTELEVTRTGCAYKDQLEKGLDEFQTWHAKIFQSAFTWDMPLQFSVIRDRCTIK
eukprot:11849560-Karenia_brevis.AAC.2